jgi:CAAX protease family protein
MPEPAVLDHILAALMVLFDPFMGVWLYRRIVKRIRAGDVNARAAGYRNTMLLNWPFAIALLLFWLAAGRPAAALGFALPGGIQLLLGAIITVLALAVLYTQWKSVSMTDDKGWEGVRAQIASIADFLPRSKREAALFRGISVTAGVCEEIWWRGFMIWYLATYVGEWPAVFIGALMFGVLHLYQGPAGVIKSGVTGLLLGILYLGTGTLLWPVIVHTAIDLQGGAMARHALLKVPNVPATAGR